MFSIWLVAAGLVLATVFIHYESLRFLDWLVTRLPDLHRTRVAVVVLGCFCAHLVEALLFAYMHYHATASWELGSISGELESNYSDYIYLSLVSYTSLGLGDIFPVGPVRVLIGVEALIGLMMIAWSATFTYLEMESLWGESGRRARLRKR